MCTIGCQFEGGVTRTFKQCDLTQETLFYVPEITDGKAGRYIAFRRKGRPGIWAGVSSRGVSFVAADYYTNESPGTVQPAAPARFLAASTHLEPNDNIDRLFRAYETSVADHDSAQSAVDFLTHWYLYEGNPGGPRPNFEYPDIALFADRERAIFVEYYPGDGPAGTPAVKTLEPQAGWFAGTNHARMFTQTVDYAKNHSTYLRLARAEALLGAAPTFAGIKTVLSDQYYGRTELSICRIAGTPGEYFTQATVILGATASAAGADYLINGNPRTKPYTSISL